MTIRLADRGIEVVLLDIEGTTTPIAFVHDVLFPFARRHLSSWLHAQADAPEAAGIARLLEDEHAADVARGEVPPAWRAASVTASITTYATWLMDRDRKSRGLKLLQGLIWEQGYQAGTLRGEVYPDVPDAVRRWRRAGVRVAIYSSGSELAQRRLFASTVHGDLSSSISAFFDTRVGAKQQGESYRRIVAELGVPASRVLFVSDVAAELAAAREAGCQVALSVRPGNPPQAGMDAFDHIRTLAEIE